MDQKSKQRKTVISLYSGAGGLDVGLRQAGLDVRVALDFDHDSCETLRENFRDAAIIEGDITKVSTREILAKGKLKKGEVDLLVGGPPCQPFSKSAFWNGSKGLRDPRAITLAEYVRVLKESKPKAFLLENVFGLAYKNHKDAFEFLCTEFGKLGYEVNWQVVNTADYGIPQIRQRLIIVGMKGKRFVFPKKTHAPKEERKSLLDIGIKPHVSTAEAFKGLGRQKVSADLAVAGKWGHLLGDIPPGNNYLFYTEKKGHPNPLFGWRTKYWSFLLKLSPDKPSWTIQAQPGPYVGPFHWEGRRLTIDEMKRIQTFPDNYTFVGRRSSVQKQIGNAVPSLLGKVFGEAIIQQLN